MTFSKASIKSILPKYVSFKKEKLSIAVMGTRRGATTYLTLLLTTRKTRVIDQPFEYFYRSHYDRTQNFKRSQLPLKELNQYYYIRENERIQMKKYLKEYESGKHSFMDSNFSLNKNNIVYKFTEGNYFIDELESLNIQPLIIFRHPISQTISCIRNNWGNIYYPYMDSIWFKENFLNQTKFELFQEIHLKGSKLEKGILDWYCSNAYLLKCWKNYPTIFYENLVLDPISIADELKNKWNIHLDTTKINRPSGSSVFSTSDFKERIGQDDYKIQHLEKDFNRITEEEKRKLNHLFNVLEINLYSPYSYKPTILS